MNNYYDILEIESNASFEEIKKAFRILAIKYHPDKNLGDNYFTDKFIEVKQAYDVLSNKDQRALFDKEIYNIAQKPQNKEDKRQQTQEQKEREDHYYRDPFKPYYSDRDRDLQETPQYNPIYNFGGGPVDKDLDFFALPKNIGKLICGYSNLFKNEIPLNSGKKIKEKIKNVIIGLVIGIVINLLAAPLDLNWILIWLFAPILIALLIESKESKFKKYNAFVGVNGFAEFAFVGDRQNITTSKEVNFSSATDLYVYYIEKKTNYSYLRTDFLFIWLNTQTGEILFVKENSFNKESTSRKDFSNGLKFSQMSEKYWTVYLLDKMEAVLKKEGFLSFNLYNHEKNIYGSYIKLGVGFITFIKGGNTEFTYRFNDIKKMYTSGNELHIQHNNFEKTLFFFKSGNEDIIPLLNLCNRQFFYKAIELLLGYKIN